MSEIQISAKGLTKEYKMGNETVRALRGVDIEIEQGSFTAIVGTSGSGKSTLLHLLGCLDRPTAGEIKIGDQVITQTRDRELARIRRERIGFVFQRFCLIQEMTVLENITAPILLSNRRPDTAAIDDLCETLGLADRKSHLPSQLSGGQQQRVAIARALANDPQMILCDEPTGNLDKRTSEEVTALLQEVNRKYRKTILIVTHDPAIAESAERVIRIEDGRII
ncbi:MAG: ABC transporter ATP-binding protein [Ruminococcus sp.]|nr:ABC transporter ATP-binding protein [Ruminococcus sp.]